MKAPTLVVYILMEISTKKDFAFCDSETEIEVCSISSLAKRKAMHYWINKSALIQAGSINTLEKDVCSFIGPT